MWTAALGSPEASDRLALRLREFAAACADRAGRGRGTARRESPSPFAISVATPPMVTDHVFGTTRFAQ